MNHTKLILIKCNDFIKQTLIIINFEHPIIYNILHYNLKVFLNIMDFIKNFMTFNFHHIIKFTNLIH